MKILYLLNCNIFYLLSSWPCLHQWLETRPNRQQCPVCKAGIGKDKVVPLYGRGSSDGTDPREKLPPRPQAQRPEPTNNVRTCGRTKSLSSVVCVVNSFNFDLGL